jgi:hypothetical protein
MNEFNFKMGPLPSRTIIQENSRLPLNCYTLAFSLPLPTLPSCTGSIFSIIFLPLFSTEYNLSHSITAKSTADDIFEIQNK